MVGGHLTPGVLDTWEANSTVKTPYTGALQLQMFSDRSAELEEDNKELEQKFIERFKEWLGRGGGRPEKMFECCPKRQEHIERCANFRLPPDAFEIMDIRINVSILLSFSSSFDF